MRFGDHGQNKLEGYHALLRGWFNGGPFSLHYLQQTIGDLLSILLRDKDTDITWLYGPLKRSASIDPLAYQLPPGQFNCIPPSIMVQGTRQRKLGIFEHRGTLLAPYSVLSHRHTQRKVCANPPIPQIASTAFTIIEETVRVTSYGKALTPSSFQSGSTAMSLFPAAYSLAVPPLLPNAQREQRQGERKT